MDTGPKHVRLQVERRIPLPGRPQPPLELPARLPPELLADHGRVEVLARDLAHGRALAADVRLDVDARHVNQGPYHVEHGHRHAPPRVPRPAAKLRPVE